MFLISPVQYKANLHAHSTLSDGRLSPEELKAAYKQKGYSVLSITDHERPYNHSALSEDGFVMITGYEAYIRPSRLCIYNPFSEEIHLNLFAENSENVNLINWNETCVKYVKNPIERMNMPKFGSRRKRRYNRFYINSFIETAKKCGYIVSLNHPTWSFAEQEFLYDLKGYFSVEICNYNSYVSGINEYNIAFYDSLLRKGRRVFCHSSDDNHNKTPLDLPGSDSFGGFTMLNTENDVLSYDSVIKSLKSGSFYSSMGPLINSLEINGNKAVIKTSEAVRICMHYGAKTVSRVYPEKQGEQITAAVFPLPEKCEYIRFSVTDDLGRTADTRGYFKDEWDKKE